MPTHLDLRNRIARDLWRAQSAQACEYDEDIKAAVRSAVLAFSGRDFWFAEQDWETPIGTVAGQAYYPLPPDLARIDNIRLLRDGEWVSLAPRHESDVDARNARGQRGVPEGYAILNQQFYIAPTPDKAYRLNMSGVRLIPPPGADDEANIWTEDAFDLVLYEAEKILWATFKGDGPRAGLCEQLAQQALTRLKERSNRYKPVPDITPMTWFYPC